jgi:hypothetical protein
MSNLRRHGRTVVMRRVCVFAYLETAAPNASKCLVKPQRKWRPNCGLNYPPPLISQRVGHDRLRLSGDTMSDHCMRCYFAGGLLVLGMIAFIKLANVSIDWFFPKDKP